MGAPEQVPQDTRDSKPGEDPQGERDTGEQSVDEREIVGLFDDEGSLNSAIDELMQIGLRPIDLSLLADSKALPESIKATPAAKELEDRADVARAAYVSPDSRTEGLAALFGLPVYVAGAGTAAAAVLGGAALIPTIAVVAGLGAAGGVVGLLLARVFGRRHAERIQDQIASGGLLLWVHAPDSARDGKVLEVLKRHGARDVHVHTVKRSWGVADVPFYDPDPFIKS